MNKHIILLLIILICSTILQANVVTDKLIIKACKTGNAALVSKMLQQKLQLKNIKKPFEIFTIIWKKEDHHHLTLLLKYFQNSERLQKIKNTLLMKTCNFHKRKFKNRLELLKILHKHGANIIAQDEYNRTALHLAVDYYYPFNEDKQQVIFEKWCRCNH